MDKKKRYIPRGGEGNCEGRREVLKGELAAREGGGGGGEGKKRKVILKFLPKTT